jgi:hypothetical protein
MIVASMTAAAVALLALSGSLAPAPPSPTPLQQVHEIVLDRSDGHLLVATHSGLYETALWVAHPTLTGPQGEQRDVTALASFDQTLYGSGRRAGDAGPSIGLATSSNHGQTWTTQAMYGYRQFRNVLVTQVDGQLHMFALDSRNSLLRSTDGGTRWSAAPGVRPNAIQTSAGRLFAATTAGVRTSADNGASWSAPDGPALRLMARGNPAQGCLVGIDAEGKVWKYLVGIWSAQGTAPDGAQALTTIESGGNLTLIVATSHGLQRSSDWGATWTDVAAW